MNNNIAVVILAAGKGTRMKSNLPKVLHTIAGRPMIEYVFDLVKKLNLQKKIIVTGHKQEWIKKYVPSGVTTVVQRRLLGTGDALKSAMRCLKNFKGTVLVLYADNPLLTVETLKKLIQRHKENNNAATLLTARLENPSGYGRIFRDKYNCITRIIEEKDANDYEKEIKEINTGIICFDKDKLLQALAKLRPDNRKKEYYLTDVIEILHKEEAVIDALKIKDIDEALGINSQEDLARAGRIMQKRILKMHMQKGINIQDAETTFIDWGVLIGRDSKIFPFTVIQRGVRIGRRCSIGPFCHLREGTVLGNDVTAGNFLEVVRTRISNSVFVKHFAYLGDSFIGKGVNIGAGSVTANFDGRSKFKTVIKDNAFIGSDTVLVAPVTVGRNASTGAGSVVVKNSKVKDNTVVAGVPAKVLKRGKYYG